MAESTHKVEVIRIDSITKHPNADKLEIINVFGYPVIVGIGDYKIGDLVAYIPPDSIYEGHRIRCKKLRGIYSHGLIVGCPENSNIGDDVSSILDVTHYEPVISTHSSRPKFIGGDSIKGPSLDIPKYDIESGRRYNSVFMDGEEVIATEKIHGANARYVYWDNQMWCGSRSQWKSEYPVRDHITEEFLLNNGVSPERVPDILQSVKNVKRSIWWQALTPAIKDFCVKNPGLILYGEVYGHVQDLRYDHSDGEVSFRAFDVYGYSRFYDYDYARLLATSVEFAPVLYRGKYNFDLMCELSEGMSTLGDNLREGIVVKPVKERWDYSCGRVALKWINPEYLTRSK